METHDKHHAPGRKHGHQHGHQHGSHQGADEAGMADTLDLDALLLQEPMKEIFALTAAHRPDPAVIMDLGAGTGTGTLGLARTFPQASIVAVDQSEFMLARLIAMVEGEGLGGRVTTEQVDLDSAWPKVANVDLVWVALAMHHMGDPDAVYEKIARTLSPGGLLVVIEMAGWVRYLPEDLGLGAPGLEQRCHTAVASAAWNSYPDWATAIEAAGMGMVERREFNYVADGPAVADKQELIAQAALAFLAKVRAGQAALSESASGSEDLTSSNHTGSARAFTGTVPSDSAISESTQSGSLLSDEDLATLDRLLDPNDRHFLGNRTDLSVRANRRVWVARTT